MGSSTQSSVWDEFEFTIPGITPEEASAFVRVLNTPEGQAFLKRAAESLLGLRRASKRKRYVPASAPVTDASALPLLLTVNEIAGLLRTSVDAVYARIQRGELTEGRVSGHKVLFHRDRLLHSLERGPSGKGRR